MAKCVNFCVLLGGWANECDLARAIAEATGRERITFWNESNTTVRTFAVHGADEKTLQRARDTIVNHGSFLREETIEHED